MNSQYIEQETAISKYVCNKYYTIDYNHEGLSGTIKGYLLNYYNGNIVILSEKGIYIMKYRDIIFMQPSHYISTSNKDYSNLLSLLQKLNEEL